MSRVAVTLAALLLVAGCASAPPSASPSTGAATAAASTASAASPSVAAPSPSGSVVPTPAATATPAPTATPSRTPVPTPPSADGFWAAVVAGIERHGHLRVRVIGPSPGVLRYTPDASATVIDGKLTFVCANGKAYDGQSGFDRVPGAWTCGSLALVEGFRGAGLPRDAWNDTLPPDDDIHETVTRLDDGSWQWSYRGLNPVFGGQIQATVVVDPASGEIRSASRRDPTGDTTYGISYTETFPAIAVP